ncbi:hypothetical protein IV203_001508 [Nitzschia inconspicua]|uniref:Uncharacterized protein n=1 Tax=Nitzschia inconspicua TaxID=303405 RepID=A0A9K3L7B4_9STRA|nr:hypothetical protein IV203_001508 [Nitzschia inconspicua]
MSQAVDSDEDPGRASPGVVVIETKIQQANHFFVPLIYTRLCGDNENEVLLLAEGARYWSVKDKNSWYDWRRQPTQTCGHRSDHSGKAMKVRPIFCVEEEDIVCANYEVGNVVTPLAVVLDHAWNPVVVTIRGSASMGDFFCDLNFFQRSLEDLWDKYDFDGKGKFAHRGIVACSAWITEDLLRFPNVKAIAYEPPGCSVSSNLAKESQEWCTSFVTGMDVIPRFNKESITALRMELLVNLARIRVPKHVIMSNRNIDQHGIDAVKEFLSEALYPHEEIPKTPFLESVQKYHLFFNVATGHAPFGWLASSWENHPHL